MLTLNEDGSADIDFPDGVVHIRPPTVGGLKRLRAERVRLAREAQDAIVAWDAEHPVAELAEGEEPDPVRRAEDRIVAAEEINLRSTEQWWRLLLVGDDTFRGLGDGPVPASVDDWPPSLLYDFRPVVPANSSVEVLLSAQSMPDQWMRHVGKGRSRSGPTAGTQPASP